MKKYMKNKNFIPEKFYNRKELYKNKKEKGFLVLLLILNLILVPITTKKIEEIKKTTLVSKYYVNNIKLNKIDMNNITIWIESILKEGISSAYITKNNGEVTVNNLETMDELSLIKSIKIEEVKKEDEKYKLSVSLDE